MKINPLSKLLASYKSVEKLNNNYDKISEAFAKTLSRDGSEPNNMQAELDMDSNRVINVGAPLEDNDAVRLKDLLQFLTLEDLLADPEAILDPVLARLIRRKIGAAGVLVTTYGTDGAALAAALRDPPMGTVYIPGHLTSFTIPLADVTDVLTGLDRIRAERPTTVVLPSGTTTVTTGDIGVVGSESSNLTVVGAEPVRTTLMSVGSVTGTAGDWTIVLNVNDGTGIAVGDVLRLYNVEPLPHLSGDNSVFRARIVNNELLHFSALAGNITTTNGGSTVTFASVQSPHVLSDIVAVNDLITIKGQTRVVTAINDGTRVLTVNSPWSRFVTGSRDYYVSKPNSGTVGTGGVASTTVNVSGGSLATEANVGDLLLCQGEMRRITALGASTISVTHNITIPNGTPYSIITAAVTHEGAHEVLAVSGNQITVRNRYRGIKPPINRVVGGEVTCFKTILKQAGSGNGFVWLQNGGLSLLDKVAIVGNRAITDSQGLAVNGNLPQGPTQLHWMGNATLGDDVVLIDWGRGIQVGPGSTIVSRKTAVSGCTENAVWLLEGASASLRSCVISGASARGLIAAAGSSTVFTEGRILGCASDGFFGIYGSAVYAEIPFFWGNQGMNVSVANSGGFHMNEGVSCCSGASGAYLSTGSEAEMARCLIAGNARQGLEVLDDSTALAEGAWITGSSDSGANGVYLLDSEARLVDAAVTGNFFWGVRALDDSTVIANRAVFGGNGDGSVQCGASKMHMEDALSQTLYLFDGAYAWAQNAGNPTLLGSVLVFNVYGNDGSLALDGTASPQRGEVRNVFTPTGSNNDYNPTNWGSTTWAMLDLSGAVTFTGLAGGFDRREVTITNTSSTGANTVTLKHEDVNSTATNRLSLPGSVDLVIPSLGSVTLAYEGPPYFATQRWRVRSVGS